MFRFLIRTILFALLFAVLLPKLNCGVAFHGQPWPDSVLWAAVFTLVSSVVAWAVAIFLIFVIIGNLGLAAIVLVPLQMLVGLALAALQLQVFASFFPEHFTVNDWVSAFLAGFFVLVINLLTQSRSPSVKSNS